MGNKTVDQIPTWHKNNRRFSIQPVIGRNIFHVLNYRSILLYQQSLAVDAVNHGTKRPWRYRRWRLAILGSAAAIISSPGTSSPKTSRCSTIRVHFVGGVDSWWMERNTRPKVVHLYFHGALNLACVICSNMPTWVGDLRSASSMALPFLWFISSATQQSVHDSVMHRLLLQFHRWQPCSARLIRRLPAIVTCKSIPTWQARLRDEALVIETAKEVLLRQVEADCL
jgi:hypothetical protein